MPRVLFLVPSATYRIADFLAAARSLGVDVVVGGEERHVLGDVMGHTALHVPLDDAEEAAAAIVAHDALAPLDAVVAVDDRGTVAAARASQRLGLRHNPPDAVAAARDKLVMRRRLDAAEVPQPTFAVVAPGDGDEAVAGAARTVGLPCVVKPTTLSASQGVLRADTVEGAVCTVARVRRIAACAGVDPGSPLLLERFVPGPEVAVEGLLVDGELEVLAVFDKPDPLDGPAFAETIYVTPTRLAAQDTDAVIAAAASACRALGLAHGPVHAEIRVRAGRASVIEVAARTIGGLCARTLSFSTGRTLEQIVLTHALGGAVTDVRREAGGSGVLMLPITRAGVLQRVAGRAAAMGVPGITDVQITIPPGRRVVPAPEGDRYLGFVFARAHDPAGAERALRQAHAVLDVQITPDGAP